MIQALYIDRNFISLGLLFGNVIFLSARLFWIKVEEMLTEKVPPKLTVFLSG